MRAVFPPSVGVDDSWRSAHGELRPTSCWPKNESKELRIFQRASELVSKDIGGVLMRSSTFNSLLYSVCGKSHGRTD